MKRALILVLCFGQIYLKAQYLTHSAEGKGAVLLPLKGVAVGLDIGKTEVTIGANNYSKALDSNNSKPFRNVFFGANLTAKNSSGFGNLFKTGDIVAGGNFLGFLGFNMNNNEKILKKWNESAVERIKNLEQSKRVELVDKYRIDIIRYVEAASVEIADDKERQETTKKLTEAITKSTEGFALMKVIKGILENKDEKLKEFVKAFKILIDPRQTAYIEALGKTDVTKELDTAFGLFVDSIKVKRFTPFIFGGIDARDFTLYKGLNIASLASSFADTLYRGGQFGLGINAQLGSFWLGVTYAYVNGDNFSNLSSKEYTLRTTDSSGNQALISEKKITGYSGKYADVESNQLNIDLVKEFKFGDTTRFITNLYYRGSLFSRDTAYLKNVSNLGLGFYFLGNKSKFIGGLYIELPDINNNVEKGKPEADRNIRPPFKKLSFGVVVKYSISSIFGFVNRPRKPDQ